MSPGQPANPIWREGAHYYAVVDEDHDEHAPQAVFLTVYVPHQEWSVYRFDRPSRAWVPDGRMMDYLFGVERGARTLTDEQAADVLKGWGGTLRQEVSQ